MNELQIILNAIEFLLGQHTNDVDPVKAGVATGHLGRVKDLAKQVLAPAQPAQEPSKPAAPPAAAAPQVHEQPKPEPAKESVKEEPAKEAAKPAPAPAAK
jgi:hypothetical protein